MTIRSVFEHKTIVVENVLNKNFLLLYKNKLPPICDLNLNVTNLK